MFAIIKTPEYGKFANGGECSRATDLHNLHVDFACFLCNLFSTPKTYLFWVV